jgi:GPI mannosyltransferase 3
MGRVLADPELLSIYRIWFIVTSILFLLAAIFGQGALHPDEHHQVLEYLNVLMGKMGSEMLTPIEYNARMRPWFQPFLYYGISAPISFLGIKSPFIHAALFRMLSGFIGLWAMHCWMIFFLREIREIRPWRYLLYGITWSWYIPMFMVRSSSDTLSSNLLLLAIGILVFNSFNLKSIASIERAGEGNKSVWKQSGLTAFAVLGGFAFLVKYQSAIVFGIVVLWMLLKRFLKLKDFVILSLLYLAICSLELLFNYFGYGEITSSTWNHAYQNVVMKMSHHFGTLPWWGYFKLLFLKGIPPFSLVLMAGSVIYFFKRPTALLTFSSVVYFFIFCVISHKEIRFLTPLLYFAPIILFMITMEYGDRILGRMKKGIIKWLVIIFAYINLLILLIASVRTVYTPVKTYRAIYNTKEPQEDIHVFYDDFNRSRGHLNFEMNFYKRDSLWNEKVLASIDELNQLIKKGNRALLVTSKYKEYQLVSRLKQCHPLHQTYPRWTFGFNYFDWLKRSSIWVLWECKS